MSDAYCKYCNHTWKHKKEYEKHIACCEYFYHYRRNPVKEMDDYGNKLPTHQELFRFVQELSLKCSRLEQDVDRLKRNASVRNKKVIADCLNHPDEIPECTFTEWWKRITLGIRYIPTEYETTEMASHWSTIENPFLFRVFRRDLVDGIKYLMTHYLSVAKIQGVAESEGRSKSAIFRRDEVSYENAKLPIRCFTQKPNVFYVYQGIQGVAESVGRSKSAIFRRDEVSYENVKYSGRAAEGVRGNSKICGGEAVVNLSPFGLRERSSSEFQGVAESEERSKSAIFRRDEVSYENDTLPKNDKPNDLPPTWRVMSSDDFETMIDGISQLFVREFLVWQRDNMESIDANEARKDEQMTYMMRVNGMRPSKERGMADIRKWLFSALEKNAKVEFEFV